MIKNISITNFKIFKQNELKINNLNILTGMNGMGKSSLIQILLILRQSHFKGLFYDPEEKYISLGDQEREDFVEIGDYRDAIYQDFDNDKDFIKIKIHFTDKTATWQTESYYEHGGDIFELPVKTTNVDNSIFKEALFAKRKFQIIKADRIGPKEFLPTSARKVKNKDFGTDGRYAMHYFLEKWKTKIPIKELAHSKEDNLLLEQQINAWLHEISPGVRVKSVFHQIDNTKIIPQFDYNVGNLNKKPFKAKNVGFGISYVFSVIMSILTAEKNDIIIIENPEAHLHPRGQTELAKLAAIAAQNGVQVFIETHSDHVLDGIRIATKQGKIQVNNLNILFFNRAEKEHTTIIEKINIDKYARFLEEPPKGFFDEFENNMMKLI